jgi:hypothetical protein
MLKHLLIFTALFLSCTLVHAQVTEDFETNDVSLFGIEGDGTIMLQTTGGNPGKCLREDDNVLGLGSFVLLSPDFLGNWPVSPGGNDSLFFDYKTVNTSGGSIPAGNFHVDLYGPGGAARYNPGFQLPSYGVWHNKKIPVDSSKWQMVSGTWTNLMQNIQRIRINTEFVTGDEYSLIDNIRTTFNPIPYSIASGLCSGFPAGSGFDGWSFMNVNGPASVNNDGNPPNCIRWGDQTNVSRLIAPPKFKGNWSGLNGSHYLSVDLKIVSNQPNLALPSYFIRIQGKGGVAEVDFTASMVDSARGKWFRFVFPLQEDAWQQVSGSWDSTLMKVTDVFIQPEFFSGGGAENISLDNFCIGTVTGVEPPNAQIADITPFPNPATTDVSFPLSEKIQLTSVLGKSVLSLDGPVDKLTIHSLYPGRLY